MCAQKGSELFDCEERVLISRRESLVRIKDVLLPVIGLRSFAMAIDEQGVIVGKASSHNEASQRLAFPEVDEMVALLRGVWPGIISPQERHLCGRGILRGMDCQRPAKEEQTPAGNKAEGSRTHGDGSPYRDCVPDNFGDSTARLGRRFTQRDLGEFR